MVTNRRFTQADLKQLMREIAERREARTPTYKTPDWVAARRNQVLS